MKTRPDFPPFRFMALAQAGHAAGDALITIALAGTLFFAVPIGEARDRVGLYLLLTMTPFALISPVVGPLLDRWHGSYRFAITVSAAARAAVALYMATRIDSLFLYPLAFSILVLSRTHGVSRAALLPEVLPARWNLITANSRLAIISVAAGAAAAGPGVALQHWAGPTATLRLAAFVLVLGTVAGIFLPRPPATRRRRHVVRGAHRLLEPRLLAGGLATAATRTAIGFLVFLIAFIFREQGEGPLAYGLVLGGAAAGGFVGAVVTPRIRTVVHEWPLILGSLVAMAAVAAFTGLRFSLVTATVVATVFGLCTASARLAFDSLIQHDAPEEVRGRTFARYETIFQLCWVAGAGVATAIPFGSLPGFAVVAAICIAGLALAIRGARAPEPADMPDDQDG